MTPTAAEASMMTQERQICTFTPSAVVHANKDLYLTSVAAAATCMWWQPHNIPAWDRSDLQEPTVCSCVQHRILWAVHSICDVAVVTRSLCLHGLKDDGASNHWTRNIED